MGAAIWKAMQRRDPPWDQKELAAAMGVSGSDVNRLLGRGKGKRTNPSAGTVLAACKVLGLNPMEEWFGDEAEKDGPGPHHPGVNGSSPPNG